jgi:hypothetical protein
MTTIYVDGSAARLGDAEERLGFLTDAGHELILVGLSGGAPKGRLAGARRASSMPPAPPRGSWFVTADPATCGDHQAGLTTLLVGPRSEDRRPTRCDVTARDLREAVLEILAADAMR